MAYWFKGAFTPQECGSAAVDLGKYAVRDLRPTYRFHAIRRRVRQTTSPKDHVDVDVVAEELMRWGLRSALVLSYATFGGRMDHLAGVEVQAGRIVEATRFDSSSVPDDDLQELFIAKLTGYGLPPREDGFLFLFVRGFWGE